MRDKVKSVNMISKQLAKWLLVSGIADLDKNSEDYGGVHAWYSAENKNYSFKYAEITGYYLTWKAYLKHIGYKTSIELVEASANWLLERSMNSVKSGFRYRKYQDEPEFRDLTYWFDNAMCMNGLLHAYHLTGKNSYKDIVINLASLMYKQSHDKGQLLPWVGEKPNKPTGAQWSNQPGSFMLKTLIPLLHLSVHFGLTKYIPFCKMHLDAYMHKQLDNGRFITDSLSCTTFLHPHLYTLEAYWVGAKILNQQEYYHVIKKGLDWILQMKEKYGFICGYVNRNNAPANNGAGADIISQIIRLMCLMSYSDDQIEQLTRELIGENLESIDDGKLCTPIYGYSMEGRWCNDHNSWAGMFAHQALTLSTDPMCKKILLSDPVLIV